MSKLINFVHKNIFILIVSIAVGIIVVLPHLWGLVKFGQEYSPLRINSNLQYIWDETYLYAAQTQHYLNGNLLGDTYLFEHQGESSPFLGEVASIIPLVIFSLLTGSVANSFFVSDFAFPTALFLLVFLIARKMTKNDLWSTVAGLTVVVTPNLSSLLPFFFKEGTVITGSLNDPLLFSRTPHPQVSLIYLFVVLFLTYILLNKPTKRIAYFWSISVGISLYSSLFVASTVALGTLMLFPLVAKKIKVKLFIHCLAIIFIIAIPYLINYLSILNFIKDTDFLERITYPIRILFPRQLRYLIFAIILTKLSKKDNLPKILIVFILAASIISDGHQFFLGKNIDADHWINRVIAPISTLSIVLIVYNLLKNRSSRIVPLALCILMLIIGLGMQILWIKNNAINFKNDPNIVSIINKIKQTTKVTDVIGSEDFEINQNITGLTGRKSYLGPADRVLANFDERTQRACDLVFLSGKKEQSVSVNLTEYAVGLLIWDKMNLTEKEKIISNTYNCQKNNYTNKYKIDYFISENSDNSYTLTKLGD